MEDVDFRESEMRLERYCVQKFRSNLENKGVLEMYRYIYIYSRKEGKNFEALLDRFHCVEMIFLYLEEENYFVNLSRNRLKKDLRNIRFYRKRERERKEIHKDDHYVRYKYSFFAFSFCAR